MCVQRNYYLQKLTKYQRGIDSLGMILIIDATQIHFQNPKSQITIKLYSAKSQIPNPKLF